MHPAETRNATVLFSVVFLAVTATVGAEQLPGQQAVSPNAGIGPSIGVDATDVTVIVRSGKDVLYATSQMVKRGTKALDHLHLLIPVEVTSRPDHVDYIEAVMGIKAGDKMFWALYIDRKFSCQGISGIIIDQDMKLELSLLPRNAYAPPAFALKGTVITPDKVLADGYVAVEGCLIRSVGTVPPKRLPIIETKGYIFPGFVDIHNHVAWNVFSPWPIRPGKYKNRYEWITKDDNYKLLVRTPQGNLKKDEETFCAMSLFAETKALIGGTTSIQGTESLECTRILVRNIDQQAFRESPDQVESIIFLKCLEGISCKSDDELQALSKKAQSEKLQAIIIHLAEGLDAESRDEFALLKQHDLLTKATIVVHGLALTDADFAAMAQAHAKLIWSPHSNLVLYGQTADVKQARLRGIEMALAPDWSISGSQNMLGELKVARRLGQEFKLGFTDEDLFKMATANPARFLGLADKIGAVAPDHYADLLVIQRKPADTNPYTALVNAMEWDIGLILISGEAVYGRRDLLRQTVGKDYEAMNVCGTDMGIRLAVRGMKYADKTYSDIEKHLRTRLREQGVPLAPLLSCHNSP